MTENQTPATVLRIRMIDTPKGHEFDEFDLRRFHVGEVYEVPARLASLLLIAGYAEFAPLRTRDVAADTSYPSRSKR